MSSKCVIHGDFPVSDKDILLTVLIDKPNWGMTKVWLEKDEKLFEQDIVLRKLGSGPDFKGKTLYLKTPVVDMDASCNSMSVTYLLEDGHTKRSFNGKLTVDSNGDTGLFIGQLKLC